MVKEEWLNGTYTAEEATGTLQLNANALGKGQLLGDLLEVSYEWVVEELANGK